MWSFKTIFRSLLLPYLNLIKLDLKKRSWIELITSRVTETNFSTDSNGILKKYTFSCGTELYRYIPNNGDDSLDIFYEDSNKTVIYTKKQNPVK